MLPRSQIRWYQMIDRSSKMKTNTLEARGVVEESGKNET